MANSEHVQIVKLGVDAIREWREQNADALFDLRDTDLREANLIGADLGEANLGGADLRGTNLTAVDLSVVKELDSIRHAGPSTVGVDTLLKSKGKISERFLRECGVPDELIAHLPAVFGTQSAIRLHSCFVGYSQQDEELAGRLYARMRQEHLRVWFAPEEPSSGQEAHEPVDEATRIQDVLVLVLSEHSMSSPWVAGEILRARQRETRDRKRILFPVRLVLLEDVRKWKCFAGPASQDVGQEIRGHLVPDFSNWKDHEAFEAGFQRLLEELKAEAERDADSNENEAE